jgi:excisionase family DNA binding protein
MDGQQDQLLRATEVANLLGIAERTLSRLVKAGEFPSPTRIGNSVRFSRAEVMAWLEGRKGVAR